MPVVTKILEKSMLHIVYYEATGSNALAAFYTWNSAYMARNGDGCSRYIQVQV